MRLIILLVSFLCYSHCFGQMPYNIGTIANDNNTALRINENLKYVDLNKLDIQIASDTYVTKTGANGTYLTKSSATSTYANAQTTENLYLRKSSATFTSSAGAGNIQIGKLLIQWGWGSIQGDNSRDINATVTYPTAYAATPHVIAGKLGYRTGAPTLISDLDSAGGYEICYWASDITTTNFRIDMEVDVDYGVLGTNTYEGYSWIAIGTIP